MSRPIFPAPDARCVSVEVWPVPKSGIGKAMFLDAVRGCNTHFYAGAPWWCPGPPHCPQTRHKEKLVWKGYAPGMYWAGSEAAQWRFTVIEVTESLNEVLRDIPLRGTVWSLYRIPGKGKGKECTGNLIESRPAELTPPAFSVLPVVMRLYREVNLKLGVLPPFGAKLALPPIEGMPPPPDVREEGDAQATPDEIEAFKATIRAMAGRDVQPPSAKEKPKLR